MKLESMDYVEYLAWKMQASYEDIIRDFSANPKDHYHSYENLRICCTIYIPGMGWVLDPRLMRDHFNAVRIDNGFGSVCDVTSGMCSCGRGHVGPLGNEVADVARRAVAAVSGSPPKSRAAKRRPKSRSRKGKRSIRI